MSKKEIAKRHAAIKALVSSKDISSQTGLAEELKAKQIDVTQATLSRDLVELGIIRVPGETGYRYELKTNDVDPALRGFSSEEIISIGSNENLVIVKTFPGRAQGIAFLLDGKKDGEILGTIAGDDTIIIVPKSIKRIKKTIHNVSHSLGIK